MLRAPAIPWKNSQGGGQSELQMLAYPTAMALAKYNKRWVNHLIHRSRILKTKSKAMDEMRFLIKEHWGH